MTSHSKFVFRIFNHFNLFKLLMNLLSACYYTLKGKFELKKDFFFTLIYS